MCLTQLYLFQMILYLKVVLSCFCTERSMLNFEAFCFVGNSRKSFLKFPENKHASALLIKNVSEDRVHYLLLQRSNINSSQDITSFIKMYFPFFKMPSFFLHSSSQGLHTIIAFYSR